MVDILFYLEPKNDSYYVLLSIIYAEARRWDNVASMRAKTKEYGVMKKLGCSWIKVRNKFYLFVTRDGSHLQSKEINGMLDSFIMDIKKVEYVEFLLHDV